MPNYLFFQVHGKADHGGVAESVENLLIFITGLLGKQPSEMVTILLPGMSALQNIHPMLVHFPIAFLLGFFVLDVVGAFAYKPKWRSVASWFLYIGTITAALTVLAGFFAAESVDHGHDVHGIMEQHESYGIMILSLACLLSFWRLQVSSLICDLTNTFFMMLSTVLCVLVFLGADLGGLMVYKYGVAVSGVKQESHDHNAGDSNVLPQPAGTVEQERGDIRLNEDESGSRHRRGRD